MANKERRLSPKEKAFADEYLETGNGVQSALSTYDTEDYSTAGVIAHENLKKPKIRHYLETEVEAVKKNMLALALNAEAENVQVSAGKDVLDRALGKPQNHVDVTTKNKSINQMGSMSNEELLRLINGDSTTS